QDADERFYVSRVYDSEGRKGEADIAVAFAVREGGDLLGVIVAELSTGPALGEIKASALESGGTSVYLLALSDCGDRPNDAQKDGGISQASRCEKSYLNPVIILRNGLSPGKTEDASDELLGKNGSPTYAAAVEGTPLTVHVHHWRRAK